MKLGKAIKIIRFEKDISAIELAADADIGCSHLSQIESGKSSPSFPCLMRIARALYMPLSKLIERAENMR